MCGQIEVIAAVERRGLNLTACHRTAQRRTRYFDAGSRRGHLDGFGDFANLQLEIDMERLIDQQGLWCAQCLAKPFPLRDDGVAADLQRDRLISSRGV